MNALERRQYEMLLRVRDFGTTHRQLFSASSVRQTFAAVSAAVDDLTATATLKAAASEHARAGRKAAARKALLELLQRVSQLARVLRARGRTQLAFELPRSKSDQSLLTGGRQFARNAATLEAEFDAHGMGPSVITATTAAFEAAVQDRGMSRADRIAARTRIQDLLASALLDVRTLDLMVENELAHDNVVQALWKQARRVEDPRTARTDEAREPASAEATAAKPTAAAA